MSQFRYRAVDTAGVLQAGELISVSREEALETLSRRGLIPVSIDEGSVPRRAGWRPTLGALNRLRPGQRPQANSRELLGLTHSLESLSKAGLTIDRALQISASLAPNSRSRLLAENLLRAVRSGKPLSAAFSASGQHLPPYFVSMVDAGEIGGSLAEALGRLTELMGKQAQTRERVRSALIYPALLAGVVLLTLVMLLLFVLPRFEVMFSESEAPLPWSTHAVLGLGRFVADYWWVLSLAVAAAIGTAMTWTRSHRGRLSLDRWLLRSRVTFGLPAALSTARLLRTVASLCENGLPLPLALRVARGTVTNRYLLEALGEVTRDVQAGGSFSTAFARSGCFPAVAVQLARVGEETGHLHEMLHSAAGALDEESQRMLERLLSLVVPLLTIGMGLVVAALIGSVLIGLLSINDLAF